MNLQRLLPYVLLASMASPQSSRAAALSTPSRTVGVREDNGGKPVPLWSRGYVFYRGSEDGSLRVYDAAYDPVKSFYETRIWPDGASIVRLNCAAASPRGIFVVGGTAFSSSGAGTGLVAFFGPNRTQRLVQLPNTGTMALAFADDGTLWVLVRQIDSSLHELSAYDLVCQYTAEGKLIRSTVPRTNFPDNEKGLTYSNASISVSADTIGIYLDMAGIWTELSYDGAPKGRWQVQRPQVGEGRRLLREQLVMTSSNEVVYVSTISGKQPKDVIMKTERLIKSGPSFVSTPIDSSALQFGFPNFPYLIGVDGGQLVWMSHNDRIQWTAIE